ncbi:hypothetical protein PLANPX_6049 [Lacipirellula parvula]|uniref:Uncharacterized protein n=1 Tax=Lacipirellula parvula TaxID=2650471 RepID=A0A5K7XJW7_9BACT|nr:hypothetical protein PLANPX_6049 [Lacipirellula parvula]
MNEKGCRSEAIAITAILNESLHFVSFVCFMVNLPAPAFPWRSWRPWRFNS